MKKNKQILSFLLTVLMIAGISALTSFNTTAVEDNCEHNWLHNKRIENCEQGGLAYYYCDRCWESKEVYIEPKEHNYEEPELSTFCGNKTIRINCIDCTTTIDKTFTGTLEHDWSYDEKIQNCEEGGWIYYQCNLCRKFKSERIEPKEHDLYDYEAILSLFCGTKTINVFCHNCNSVNRKTTIKGTKEHNLEDSEIPDLSTFCGNRTIHINCTNCEDGIDKTFTGTREHEWEPDFMDTTEFIYNCNVGGTLPYYCCNCGTKKDVYMAPKEHTIYWTSNNDATCTKDGTKQAWCNECLDGSWGQLKINAPDEGTALGHDHSGDWTVLLPATCSDRGVQIKNCQRCLNAIISEAIPATEHVDADDNKVCDECNAKLADTTVPDDTNPDEGTTDTPETPDEPTEPEEPKKEANVFSFLTEFLNNIIDFFKKLFKL